MPEILADDCEPLTQTSDLINGEAEQEKLAYFVQALKEAQSDIERLTTENLKLHEANGDLNNEIAHLKTELASLKQQ